MPRKPARIRWLLPAIIIGAAGLVLFQLGRLPGQMLESITPVQFRKPGERAATMRSAAAVRGPVNRVIDGDSLVVNGVEIRLHGIDAPELRQTCRRADGTPYPCGRKARDHLRKLVRGRNLDCRRVTTDRYGRMVAVCMAGGTDIGRRMVQDGWAVAFVRYSRRYVADERKARQARAGMWQGRFVPPSVWRDTQRH